MRADSREDSPAEANGQTLGDWEMDTIVGKDGKALAYGIRHIANFIKK